VMRGVIAKRIGGSLEATHLQHVAGIRAIPRLD
jgi:hypothetical protein